MKYKSYSDYPVTDQDLWLHYGKTATEFKIWSPVAEAVKLHFYKEGNGGTPTETHNLKRNRDGVWKARIKGDLAATFYTYQVKVGGSWMAETPGIYARAVGLNGRRAMVVDMETTNPEGWGSDKGREVPYPNDAVIYEMHVRDFTIQAESGVVHKGKYLGLTEEGTKGPGGVSTGLDHLKDLGITHVHLLPVFDYTPVDEANPTDYNWGYNPLNFNVPEGSYSTDPYDGAVRIREFKQMVNALHKNHIGVIMDVVYNHTSSYDSSNFNLEVPGYYYRHKEDGTPSNATATGTETASERPMMRKFMIASLVYWAKEYHIDGFRFDLMGVHDIETMNEIADTLRKINPDVILYGEGWTAGDSPLPADQRALKSEISRMPHIAAFSDEIRDGLKGSVFIPAEKGFVSGAGNMEESVKMGIVGCIPDSGIDYSNVRNSDKPWASQPWQCVDYVSCHDNMTLFDKLTVSCPDTDEKERIAMDKLANAVVLTSQGISFIHSGAEMLRTKDNDENSYVSPDSINEIDWGRKLKYIHGYEYYKNLISFRKAHPAFRMTSADDVRKNLNFGATGQGLISYRISNHANGDRWKNIYVIYNAKPEEIRFAVPGEWKTAVMGDDFNTGKVVRDYVDVPAISMVVVYQE